MRQCTGCKIDKPLAQFRKDRRFKSGRASRCTVCNRGAAREYTRAHLDEAAVRWKGWRAAHPARYILWRARQRAKQAGLEFCLTETDIMLPSHCPVFGVRLNYAATKGDPWAASLDRKDSALGYVRGNVQVISQRANQLKNDATLDDIRKLLSFLEQHA